MINLIKTTRVVSQETIAKMVASRKTNTPDLTVQPVIRQGKQIDLFTLSKKFVNKVGLNSDKRGVSFYQDGESFKCIILDEKLSVKMKGSDKGLVKARSFQEENSSVTMREMGLYDGTVKIKYDLRQIEENLQVEIPDSNGDAISTTAYFIFEVVKSEIADTDEENDEEPAVEEVEPVTESGNEIIDEL